MQYWLCSIQIRRGNLQEADEAVEIGWENFDMDWQTYAGWWETISILEAEAELALAKGDLDQAKRCVEQFLGKFEELKLRHFKPGILCLRARIELAAGNEAEARQTLSAALVLSASIGSRRKVWEMCMALERLEAKQGNESTAIQMKERAPTEAKLIAEHAATPELREIFLSQAEL